jgi:hypothetical protein
VNGNPWEGTGESQSLGDKRGALKIMSHRPIQASATFPLSPPFPPKMNHYPRQLRTTSAHCPPPPARRLRLYMAREGSPGADNEVCHIYIQTHSVTQALLSLTPFPGQVQGTPRLPSKSAPHSGSTTEPQGHTQEK